VVSGMNGMDEITITDSSLIWEINGASFNRATRVYPEDFGLGRGKMADIQGGGPDENAIIILDVLKGTAGPRRDIVVINSAAAILAGDRVTDIKEGVKLAQDSIDSGRALAALDKLIELTNSF
jgi:anthranilate phosphoribosyltransferase